MLTDWATRFEPWRYYWFHRSGWKPSPTVTRGFLTPMPGMHDTSRATPDSGLSQSCSTFLLGISSRSAAVSLRVLADG